MTKKFIFALALVAAAFVSCDKQEVAEPSVTGEGAGLVINASFPDTKLVYTDNGTSGISATFKDGTDRLIAYFRNSGGGFVSGPVNFNLDPATLSLDKKSATFKAASDVTIPATAASLFLYLDNEANGMYAGTSFSNLQSQDGTLEGAAKLQVIYGSQNISSMTEDGAGNKVADVSFEYKTSVLNLQLTFPAGIVPTADENTTITITGTNIYNKVHISWGNPGASSTKGAITVHPYKVEGQVASAYVTVWGGSDFTSDAKISAEVGGKVCSVDFDATSAVAAGKIYSVKRTLNVPSLDKWVNDTAASSEFLAGLSISDNSTDGWLSYNAGTGAVAWTANTTGKPRVGTITFTNGATAKVSQLEVNDFKGTYSFRSQVFSNNATVMTAGADKTIELTIQDALVGETLNNVVDGKSYTNNLGVKGLYLTAVADAYLGIDYEGKDVKFGLFLDERKAQSVANGNATYPYVCFIPEGGTTWNSTTMASPWKFVPIPISASQNYQWLWFDVKNDFTVLNYDYGNKQVLPGTDGTAGTTVIGITCAVAKTATPSASDIYTTYNVIYQANPNKKMNTGGFTITRK